MGLGNFLRGVFEMVFEKKPRPYRKKKHSRDFSGKDGHLKKARWQILEVIEEDRKHMHEDTTPRPNDYFIESWSALGSIERHLLEDPFVEGESREAYLKRLLVWLEERQELARKSEWDEWGTGAGSYGMMRREVQKILYGMTL